MPMLPAPLAPTIEQFDVWPEAIQSPDGGELHLWFAPITPGSTATDDLYQCLSPDEISSLARGASAAIRRRRASSRVVLRRLLGLYLRIEPAAVPIAVAPGGRPSVPTESFDFNLSHSGDWMAVALSAMRPVGVDLEMAEAFEGMEGLARTYFKRQVAEEIMTAEGGDGTLLFHQAWTRLEAVQKATGAGLTAMSDGNHSLHLTSFRGPDRTVGAVALPREPSAIRCRELPSI